MADVTAIAMTVDEFARVELEDCQHGVDACYVSPRQITQDKRAKRGPNL